jgi:8-oxo-dGTP pyrophosphatase MutT (NUDIX family)
MKQRLEGALSRRHKRHIEDPGLVPSAVLVPIYQKYGEYHILFIQRTHLVRDHKGQVSFPGGAYEEADGTLLRTALREAEEEIGLAAEDVEVIGELDDILTTVSHYIISPFVAFIPWPYRFQVDGWETGEIIEVPISALMDENCVRPDVEFLWDEEVESYSYFYQGKVIWGASARILHQLLGIIADIGLG